MAASIRKPPSSPTAPTPGTPAKITTPAPPDKNSPPCPSNAAPAAPASTGSAIAAAPAQNPGSATVSLPGNKSPPPQSPAAPASQCPACPPLSENAWANPPRATPRPAMPSRSPGPPIAPRPPTRKLSPAWFLPNATANSAAAILLAAAEKSDSQKAPRTPRESRASVSLFQTDAAAISSAAPAPRNSARRIPSRPKPISNPPAPVRAAPARCENRAAPSPAPIPPAHNQQSAKFVIFFPAKSPAEFRTQRQQASRPKSRHHPLACQLEELYSTSRFL